MGTGIGHFIPLFFFLATWAACLVSLAGRPLIGLYCLIPLLPYRTLRDHFLDYPLGGNITTILVICIILGALFQGRHLPKSKLYFTWLLFAVYLYFSMWIGTMLGNGPAPLWLSDVNFVTWKDYMLQPLIFVAAGLAIQNRKDVRTVILIAAIAMVMIDRSSLLNSLSRSWAHFDESKRDGGPLGFAGSNGLAAFLAQFSLFFWGFAQFVKTRKYKIAFYALVAASLFATMYTFSRAAYIAILLGAIFLGILKTRKLLVIVAIFLFTWQVVLPVAVTQRITMTQDSSGHLEQSGEERIRLWEAAKSSFASSPIVGIGYATFQMTAHTDNLRDTHNWYVKVLVETGLIGFIIVLALLFQTISLGYRLFRTESDPLYQGLGLGFLLLMLGTMILNFFGDRWTYLEINGLLWVIAATAARVKSLDQQTVTANIETPQTSAHANPYLLYR